MQPIPEQMYRDSLRLSHRSALGFKRVETNMKWSETDNPSSTNSFTIFKQLCQRYFLSYTIIFYVPQPHILFSFLLKYVHVLPFDAQILISERYGHNVVCYIVFCIFLLPKLDQKKKNQLKVFKFISFKCPCNVPVVSQVIFNELNDTSSLFHDFNLPCLRQQY